MSVAQTSRGVPEPLVAVGAGRMGSALWAGLCASIAANYVIMVQAAAAELLATTGLEARMLVPIAPAALDNRARMDPSALIGPVARGEATLRKEPS